LSPAFGQLSGDDSATIDDLDRAFPPAAKSTSSISIVKSKDDEINSYKMSVVNDSGVYLPPSPPEKKSFWRRESASSTSQNRPPLLPPDEQFTISRESFDSYRRSFDISARSPITDVSPGRLSMDARPTRMTIDTRPRMSLDSRPSRMSLDSRPSRMSLDQRSPRMPPTVHDVEERENEFEEVKLNDDTRSKKHGIFHRFGGDHGAKDGLRPKSGIFGRRDHATESGHESELKAINRDDK